MHRASRRSRVQVWAVAVGLAATVFAWRYLSFEEYGNDHFVHLSQAQQMLHGLLPVRDFVERGIPLMTATSAAAQMVWGEGLRAEVLLVEGAFAVAAGLLFLVTAAVSRSAWVGLLATFPTVVVFPVGYSYPKLLLYAAALALAVRYARRPTPGRSCEMGAILAAGFLFRHDHGLLLALAAVTLVVVCHGATRAAALALARVVVVSLVLVSPFLLWVQAYQGLGSYVAQELAFSRRESQRSEGWWIPPTFALDRDRPLWSPLVPRPIVNVRWRSGLEPEAIARGEVRHGLTRLSPAGPGGWHYELRWWGSAALGDLVRDPDVAATDGIDRSTLRLTVPQPAGLDTVLARVMIPGYGLRLRYNGVGVWFYLIWALPILMLAELAWRGRTIDPAARAVAIVAIVLQLAMNVTMIRDPLATRIRDVLVPAAVMLAFLMGRPWHGFTRPVTRAAARGAVSAVLLCLIVVSGAVGEASERLETARVGGGAKAVRDRLRALRRVVLAGHTRTGRLDQEHQPIVDYLRRCTGPDSRILTMTFAPELFFFTGRLFAAGQVSVASGYFDTDADQRLMVSRLMQEDVPMVVLDSESRDDVAEGYPHVMAWVGPRYREAGRFRAGSDREFILLADAARPAPGRFADTDLPCFVP